MYQPTDIALIIDLEATCNDNNSFPIEAMEIIKIGAVITTLAGEFISQSQTFVRPQLNPVLTIFCQQLTGIQQSEIDKAPTFLEARSNLQNFLHPHHPLKFGKAGEITTKDKFYWSVKDTLLITRLTYWSIKT